MSDGITEIYNPSLRHARERRIIALEAEVERLKQRETELIAALQYIQSIASKARRKEQG